MQRLIITGDIHEMQKKGVVPEPPLPKWFPSSILYTRQYLLQSNVSYPQLV